MAESKRPPAKVGTRGRYSFLLEKFFPADDPSEGMLPLKWEQIERMAASLDAHLRAMTSVALDPARPVAARIFAAREIERLTQATHGSETPRDARAKVIEAVVWSIESLGPGPTAQALDDETAWLQNLLSVTVPTREADISSDKGRLLCRRLLASATTPRGKRREESEPELKNELIDFLGLPPVDNARNLKPSKLRTKTRK